MDRHQIEARAKAHPFESVSETICILMRDEIVKMHLMPKEKVNIAHMSEQLKISRSPIYVATEQLISEGLLHRRGKGKSLIVAPMDKGNLTMLCEARVSIEGVAAYYAAQRITEEQIIELEKHCTEYTNFFRGTSAVNQAVSDQTFHKLLVEASNNSYLIQMHHLIENQLLRYRYFLNTLPIKADTSNSFHEAQIHHWGMLNALKLRLPSVVKDVAEQDAQYMLNCFLSF